MTRPRCIERGVRTGTHGSCLFLKWDGEATSVPTRYILKNSEQVREGDVPGLYYRTGLNYRDWLEAKSRDLFSHHAVAFIARSPYVKSYDTNDETPL